MMLGKPLCRKQENARKQQAKLARDEALAACIVAVLQISLRMLFKPSAVTTAF
jgi:hypothetical protein